MKKAPRNLADRLLGTLHPDLHPTDLDGSIGLLPDVLFPNQHATQIDEYGQVEGFEVDLGQNPTGRDVYVSEASTSPSGGQETMSRQNLTPLPYESYSWTAAQPIIRGSRPRTQPLAAEALPRPERPIVVNVPVGKEGFPGGRRLLYTTYSRGGGGGGAAGRHTLPSEPTEMTLGDGQGFLFAPGTEAPAGALVGVWLTEEAAPGEEPNPATARLQRVVAPSRTAIAFNGPYHAGRRLPARDETLVARPAPLRIAGRRAQVRRISGPGRLMAGSYRFARSVVFPGGGEVASFPSNVVQVQPERVTRRRRVGPDDPDWKPPGERGSTANAAANANAGGPAPPAGVSPGISYEPPGDLHQAEGKKAPAESAYVAGGGAYLGEEIDAEESRLYGLMNARRRESGVPALILSKELNAEAYRRVSGPNPAGEPGYPGSEHIDTVATGRDDAREAMRLLHSGHATKRRHVAVGMARESAPGGFRWCVVYGDTDDAPGLPETAAFEFVDDGGAVHSCNPEDMPDEPAAHAASSAELSQGDGISFADATLRPPQVWHCVRSFSLNFSYSGSFGPAVSSGTSAWHGKSRVSVQPGGSVVRVTDGAISSYARCYSDGRIILSSSVFARAAASANRQAVCHEFGHALGLPHNSGNSVMQPSINTSGSGNITSPTTADVNTVVGVWGPAGTGGTGGGGATNPPPESPDAPEPPRLPYFVWETVVLPYRRGELFAVPAPPRVPGSVGWRLLAQIGGRWHNVHGSAAPNGATAYFPWSRRVVYVHGEAETLAPVFRGRRWSLTQSEYPEGNTTSIEAPGSAPALPSNYAQGPVLPARNRWYWIGVSDTAEGEDGTSRSVMSDPRLHFLPLGNTFRVIFPDQMNLLRNAEGRDRDADGRPSDWAITTPNGSYRWEDGRHVLATAGATSSSTPVAAPPPFAVDQSSPFTVVGALEVQSQAGSGELVMEELRSAGTIIRITILKSLSGAGRGRVERVFTPGSLHPETTEIRIRGRMAGATKNLTMSFFDLGVHPFESAPRKVRAGGPGEAADFSPRPDAGYPPGPLSAVGPPPETGGEVAATPPVEILDFRTSDGPGWPVSKSPAATVSEFTDLPDGARGWRSYDPTTSVSAHVRRIRAFTEDETDGAKIALRTQFVIRGGVGAVARHYVQPVAVHDASGSPLAFIALTAGGFVHMYLNRRGTYVGPYGLGYWQPGFELDIELILSDVGSAASRIDALFGSNGSTRRPVQTVVIDWSGRSAGQARIGIVAESSAALAADLVWRRVALTESGEAVEGVAEPPALEPFPEPDRPSFAAAPLWGGTGAADRTAGSDGTSFAGRDSLAVSVGVNSTTATRSSEKAVADIRDGGGAVLAEIVFDTDSRQWLRAGGQSRQVSVRTASLHTIELAVSGAGTLAGAARAYHTPPGSTERRLLGLLTNLDFEGLHAERAVVHPPSGYTVGAVAITASGSVVHREANERGEAINQWYMVIPPGVARTVDTFYRMPVLPGATYNLAVRGRHFRPSGETVAPSHPFHITLHSESGRVLDCGSVYGPDGCVGREGWSEKTLAFTVPEDFGAAEARLHHTNLGEGAYIWQDIRPSKGSEPREGYARALGPAEMVTTLPGFNAEASPFAPDYRIPLQVAQAVPASIPDGCAVDVSWRSSEDGIGWSESAHDAAVLLPARRLQVEQVLYGDGVSTPLVPAGTPSLRTLAMLPELTHPDGSPVGAGAFCPTGGGKRLHEPVFRPEYVIGSVAGRVQATGTTEAIGRVEQPFSIGFARSKDAREFARLSVGQEWQIEAPYLMRDVHPSGVVLTVQFREVLDPEEFTNPIVWPSPGGLARHVWSVAEASGCDVLEVAPLDTDAEDADVVEAEVVSEDSLWVGP